MRASSSARGDTSLFWSNRRDPYVHHRFKPILVHYGSRSEVLRPFETASDLAFLVNAGFDRRRCVRLDNLRPFKLLAKLSFDVPTECSVYLGRDQVEWDGTSLGAFVNGSTEEISWDFELEPGDRVEFRDVAKKPRWDAERRELWFGGQLIKVYKFTSVSNQELVLTSFEEEGWPGRVDDPIPPKAGMVQKRRLADTIHALNENHETEGIIRFRGDGTSKGVVWETVR